MKKLDPNRYYKIKEVSSKSPWYHKLTRDRTYCIVGAIIRPTGDQRLGNDGWWGYYEVMVGDPWDYLTAGQCHHFGGLKLRLIPPNQQEKIDGLRQSNS